MSRKSLSPASVFKVEQGILGRLNGKQGVMMMVLRSNKRNLILKDEVVEAMREGKYHI